LKSQEIPILRHFLEGSTSRFSWKPTKFCPKKAPIPVIQQWLHGLWQRHQELEQPTGGQKPRDEARQAFTLQLEPDKMSLEHEKSKGKKRVLQNMYIYLYTNWWYTYPSEKYESQLGLFFPIYGKIKNVPNHQPVYIYTCKC